MHDKDSAAIVYHRGCLVNIPFHCLDSASCIKEEQQRKDDDALQASLLYQFIWAGQTRHTPEAWNSGSSISALSVSSPVCWKRKTTIYWLEELNNKLLH